MSPSAESFYSSLPAYNNHTPWAAVLVASRNRELGDYIAQGDCSCGEILSFIHHRTRSPITLDETNEYREVLQNLEKAISHNAPKLRKLTSLRYLDTIAALNKELGVRKAPGADPAFVDIDQARAIIARMLSKNLAFEDVPPDLLNQSVHKLLERFKLAVMERVNRGNRDGEDIEQRIRDVMMTLCENPYTAGMESDSHLALSLKMPYAALRVAPYMNMSLAPKAERKTHFHYEFNPNLIAASIQRVELNTSQPVRSYQPMADALKAGTFLTFAHTHSLSDMQGMMRMHMAGAMVPGEEMNDDKRAELLRMLDALKAAYTDSKTIGPVQRKQYLRSIERWQGYLSTERKIGG